jgi:hypothetical protein
MRIRYVVSLSLAIGLTGATAVLVFATGPVPLQLHQEMTAVLPGVFQQRWQLLLALLLAGVGVLYSRTQTLPNNDTDTTDSPDTVAPEDPQTPPQVVGEQFETTVSETLQDLRQGTAQPEDDTDPQQVLRDNLTTAVQLRDGCSQRAARSTIQAGSWTDDRLAQAFLSDEIAYPPRHQLLEWGRTDLAYERALEHTVQVVERMIAAELPGYQDGMEGRSGGTIAHPTPPGPHQAESTTNQAGSSETTAAGGGATPKQKQQSEAETR